MDISRSARRQSSLSTFFSHLSLLAIATLWPIGIASAQGVSATASPSTLTFAAEKIGATSAPQTVTLSVSGFFPVFFNSATISGSNTADFAATNNCPSILFNGQSCAISVTFKASAAGTRQATLNINDSAPGSPQQVSLTGSGFVPETALSVSPSTLTFGTQITGTSSGAMSSVITNTGNQPVTISSITLGGANVGDFVERDTCGPSLAVSGTCTVSVTFTPIAAGTRTASIAIVDNAQGSPQQVSLSGTGQAPIPNLVFSPAAEVFGKQNIGTSTTASVSVFNNGTGAAAFSSFAISGTNAKDFAIASNTCGSSLAENAQCQIGVSFTPSVVGAESAALLVAGNQAGSPQMVSLSGTGQTPPIANLVFTPPAGAFGTQNIGTSATATFTVVNNGNAAASFSSFAISGTNAKDFAIASNTCGTTLPVNAQCQIGVSFTPSVVGAESAALVVAGNQAGSPQMVSLSGTGQTPPIANLVFTPPAGAFGTQNIGTSATATFTVVNNGNAAASFSSFAISGTNAKDFAIASNTCGTTLPVNAQCQLGVSFTPSVVGAESAALVVAGNQAGSPQMVSLSGTGQTPPIANLVFTPPAGAFGTQNIGTSATATFTIVNNGNAAATFTSFAISGTNANDFAIAGSTCGTSLAVNAQCQLGVRFKPSVVGAESAALVVAGNQAGSPQLVSLNGAGQTAPIANLVFTPPAGTFGTQNVGTSAVATLTIVNNGNATATFSSFAISGTNAKDFAIVGNACGTSLSVNAECQLEVSFRPSAGGAETAALVVTGNQAGSPQQVSLSGTGQAVMANLMFNPTAEVFGTQNIGTSATATVSVLNNGTGAATFSSFTFSGPNAKDFAIASNTCGTSLAVNAQCQIGVSFTPSVAGAESAALVVAGNQVGSPQSVSLSGTGQAAMATLVFNPPAEAFGTHNIGTSTSASLTVLNSGTGAATLSSFTISGANLNDFAIVSNTCGTSLAVNAQCQIGLSFKPSVAGAENAALVVTGNQSGSPQQVGLSGTGQAAIANLVFNPAAGAFGTQNIGTSATVTFTVVNSGSATATIGSFSISGTNAKDFTIAGNACGTSLAVNAQCQVEVSFKPSVTGAETAALVVTGNQAGSPQSVSLSGTGQTPPAANLVFTPPSGAFGTQNIGTSNTVTFTVVNSGNAAATISSLAISGANAKDFAIASNTCGTSLAVNAQCQIGLSFKPSLAGAESAALVVTGNQSGSPQQVSLSGTGQTPPAANLVFNPPAGAFGTQNIGASNTVTFTVVNSGNAAATISLFAIGGTNAKDFMIAGNACGTSLAVNAQCQIDVSFKPSVAGAETAVLVVTGNQTGSPQQVSLSGTGQTPATANLVFTPPAGAFGTQNLGTSAAVTFTVANSGNAAANINSFAISGANGKDFAIASNTCGTSLAVNAQCQIGVSFKPSVAGAENAALVVTGNQAGSPQSVSLSGTGQAPIGNLVFNPASGAFGTQKIGTSGMVTFTVVNNGSATATLSAFAISGTNANDFTIAGNACGSSLAVNAQCQIEVSFKPSVAGAETAALQVTGNQAGSPQLVSLTGTGQAPPAATLVFNPPAGAFGTQIIGTSATVTFTIVNSGNAAATINSFAISGTNANDFAITDNTCGTSLAVNAQCQIDVSFGPSVAGAETAALVVTGNQAGSPQQVNLSGTGQERRTSISVSPASVAFVPQTVISNTVAAPKPLAVEGLSAASLKYVYVTNNGTSALHFSNATITGSNAADFSISTNLCTENYARGSGLPKGTSCYVSIAFKPSVAGVETATLNVFTSGSGQPQTVALRGTGQSSTAAALSLSQDYAAFSNVPVGESRQAAVVVSPTGALLTLARLTVTGPNAGEFTVVSSATNRCLEGTPMRSACNLSIQFAPLAEGLRTARLELADEATGKTETISLLGNATGADAGLRAPASVYGSLAVNTKSSPRAIVFQNTAASALALSAPVVTGTNAEDFAIQATTCGAWLAARASCSVTVTFTPSAVGARTGAVSLASLEGSGTVGVAPLVGDGTTNEGILTLDRLGVDFGGVALETAAASTETVQITNTGSGEVHLSDTPVLSGANAGDFKIQTNGCTGALAAKASCTVSLQFRPSGAGLRTAALRLADDASNTPQIVALAGSGVAPAKVLFGSAASVDFGLQTVGGSSVNSVSLISGGTANVNVNSAEITGANAADFSLIANGCAGKLSTSCAISVAFAPTATGLRTASLVVTSDADAGVLTIPLSGLSQTAGTIAAQSNMRLDFGAENLNTQNTLTVTLTNASGTAGLTGANASDFVIAANDCAATVTGNCKVTVAFTPSGAGARAATLQVGEQTVALSGTGQIVSDLLSVSTKLLTMEAKAVDLVQISNTGSDAVAIRGIAVSGMNAADFRVVGGSGSCGSTLAAGSSCNVYLQFTPSVNGWESATLTVLQGGPSGPMVVGLRGRGL